MSKDHIAEVGKMIDWDKPLRTKSGLPARLVTCRSGSPCFQMGVIVEHVEIDSFTLYTTDGRYLGTTDHPYDLENVTELMKVHIPIA